MFYVYFNTRIFLQVISYPVLSTLLLISFGIFIIDRKFRKLPMDDYILALRMQNYTPRPLVDSDETQFKELEVKKSKFNFAEVDYLSFRNNEKLINEVAECIKHYGVGTCGPRHFYGSTDVHYALEQAIAAFLNVEDAIVYSYGYSTIASSVACYCQLGDLVFIDDLCNIAIVMGMASRKSTNIYFEHNNPHAFQKILEKMNKQYPDAKKILILEGIYAKDGSICPLKKFIKIAKRYKVRIFIDESISLGTLGKEGRGITEYYQININEIDMIIGSLEHALHSNGGFCAGSQNIIEHQRLSSGGYIFSASLQTFSVKAALIALQNIGNKTLTLRMIALRADKFLRSIDELQVRSHPESPLKVFCFKGIRKHVLAKKFNEFLMTNSVYVLVENENFKMNFFVDFGQDENDFDELFEIMQRGVNECVSNML